MGKTSLSIVTLLLFLVDWSDAAASSRPLWLNWTFPAHVRAEALVSELTLQEKCAQLVTDAHGIKRLGVPSYHWRNNVLHGPVENGVSTIFPQAIGLAATWDTKLLFDAATIWSDEVRAIHNTQRGKLSEFGLYNSSENKGLDLWGPNINMFVHPRWGRGQETYGEDPLLTGKLAAALVRGLQAPKDGIFKTLATPKHFDAYVTDRTPPRTSIYEYIPEELLKQYYFPAFARVVKAGAKSIMCSLNGIDTVYNNKAMSTPMCASPLLDMVLRKEMGFDGYIVTDSGAIRNMVTDFHHFERREEAATAALLASVDLNSGSLFNAELCSAVRQGMVSEDKLDVALRRVFKARIEAGLLDPIEKDPFRHLNTTILNSPNHRRAAYRAATESFVLLKNDKGFLPFKNKKADIRRVALVGPAANDTLRMVGNYYGCTYTSRGPLLPECNIETPLEPVERELKALGIETKYVPGCDQSGTSTSGFAAAVDATSSSDAVITFVGLTNCVGDPRCEAEGIDRKDLRLPGVQHDLLRALIETGKPVVIVLMSGGAVDLSYEAEHSAAIVATWYAGTKGGQAIADLLVGKVSPSGRLPITFPFDKDLASPLGTDLKDWPGRTYQFLRPEPLYSFGFGLSYSQIKYSGAKLERTMIPSDEKESLRACVQVSLAAASPIPIDDTVMVFAKYLGDEPVFYRPYQKLVGFTKARNLSVDGHQVCVLVDLDAMKLVGPSRQLELHTGKYELSIGGRGPMSMGKFVPESAVAPPLLLNLMVVKPAHTSVQTS